MPKSTDTQQKPFIVYGLYLNPHANWKVILSGQLRDLRSFKLNQNADLHIIVTNESKVPHDEISSIISESWRSDYTLDVKYENAFEYWAIHKLWQLSITNPNRACAYLHSKGISTNPSKRIAAEKLLTRQTFSCWRKILKILGSGHIMKVGLFPCSKDEAAEATFDGGWVWFNFWWANCDYIRRLPEPTKSNNRFTYEYWLGQQETSAGHADHYSLYSFDNSAFTPAEANRQIRRLGKTRYLKSPMLRRIYFRALNKYPHH